MANKEISPPFVFQGSKRRIFKYIKALVPSFSGRWIEPFLGTGYVALNMNHPKALLSDINFHVINFYKSLQNGLDLNLLKKEMMVHVEKHRESGKEYYYNVKNRFDENPTISDFLFLIRCGFSHMCRFTKKGKWEVPYGYVQHKFSELSVSRIIDNLRRIKSVIRPEPDWIIMSKSFEDVIVLANEDDFVYCDPPYIGLSATYLKSWNEKNEEKLHELLSNLKCKFMLSNWYSSEDKINPFIKKYWDKYNIFKINNVYKVCATKDRTRNVVEALICNYDFNLSYNEDLPLFDDCSNVIKNRKLEADIFN